MCRICLRIFAPVHGEDMCKQYVFYFFSCDNAHFKLSRSISPPHGEFVPSNHPCLEKRTKKRMFFGDFAKSWKGGIFLLSSLFQGVSEGSHPPTLWVSVEPPWQKAVCASIRYIPLGRLHQRPQESLDERIKWYVVEVLGKLPSQFGPPISPEGSLPIRIDLFKEKSLSDAQESWSNIRANAWGVA